jgi:hypothetical protein
VVEVSVKTKSLPGNRQAYWFGSPNFSMNRYLADVPPQETVATFLAGQPPASAFCSRLQASPVLKFLSLATGYFG